MLHYLRLGLETALYKTHGNHSIGNLDKSDDISTDNIIARISEFFSGIEAILVVKIDLGLTLQRGKGSLDS